MIDDHKHCVVCGKPMDPDKTVCSPSCDELMKQQQKKRCIHLLRIRCCIFGDNK